MRFLVPSETGQETPVTCLRMLAGVNEGHDRCQVAFVRVAAHDKWPTGDRTDLERMVFVCRGAMTVRGDAAEVVVESNDLIRLPPSFHCTLENRGADELVCLQITTRGSTDEKVDLALDDLVARFRGHPPIEESTGFDYQFLANRRSGSTEVAMNVARVLPGHKGPDFHIHKFDQFYFVLAGQLTVEIGFQKIVVEPFTLVKLPAGIVHRQGNVGTVPERHVAIVCPAPMEGEPLDYQIDMPAP